MLIVEEGVEVVDFALWNNSIVLKGGESEERVGFGMYSLHG